MDHFGVICPTGSHLTTCFSLRFELPRRGHRISFLNVVDVQVMVELQTSHSEQLARQSFLLFPKRFEPSRFELISENTVL